MHPNHVVSLALATAPPYSAVMLKEKSRVSPGAMTVTLRLCSNTSSSLVSVAWPVQGSSAISWVIQLRTVVICP